MINEKGYEYVNTSMVYGSVMWKFECMFLNYVLSIQPKSTILVSSFVYCFLYIAILHFIFEFWRLKVLLNVIYKILELRKNDLIIEWYC